MTSRRRAGARPPGMPPGDRRVENTGLWKLQDAEESGTRQGTGALQCRLRPRPAPLALDSSNRCVRCRSEHGATNTTQQGRYPAHDDAVMSLQQRHRHVSIWPVMLKYDGIN